MAIPRWLSAAFLVGTFGCSGTVTSATDGGDDGAASGDATFMDAGTGSDARGSDAGATDAGCVTGSVSFDLHAAPGTASAYCLGGPGTCSTQWLDIRSASGSSFTIQMPCQTTCAACQPIACTNLCAAPGRLGDAGVHTTWDGTYFASGTCGAGLTCASQACAPAGTYTAKACGYLEAPDASAFGGCSGASTPTCAEMPFTWPPPAGAPPVQLVLGASTGSAGSCCPVGWSLSSCTYPDGGAGQQCHNPALGCASSTTCGAGCDSVVTGRCDGG